MLGELSLKAYQEWKQDGTGFVHIDLRMIPTYENFCSVFTLMNTHIGEHMREGIKLMTKLLAFQNDTGGFPVYLHEYPKVRDPRCGVNILVPLFWIYRKYQSIFTSTLRKMLLQVMKNLYVYCCKYEYSRVMSTKLEAFGIQMGWKPFASFIWKTGSSQEWSHLILAMQMLIDYKEEQQNGLQSIKSLWNEDLCVYQGYSSSVTLLDLFCSVSCGQLPDRLRKIQPIHLQAALLFPITLEWKKDPNLLYWGDKNNLHSLVCRKQVMKVDQKFIYPEEIDYGIELSIFTESNANIFINGVKSTTFQLSDEVEIRTTNHCVVIHIEVTLGEGIFMGHLSFNAEGNYKIGIRTIRRSAHLTMRMQIKLLGLSESGAI